MEFLQRSPGENRAALSEHSRRPSAAGHGLSLRALLILGFGGVLLLWLFSAFFLIQGMAAADERGTDLRGRFLQNDRLLSIVTTRTLQTSIEARDVLLDPSQVNWAALSRRMAETRAEVDRALDGYEPGENSDAEAEQWYALETELRAYWDSLDDVTAVKRPHSTADVAALFRDEIIPKRQAIVRILDQINSLNETAFQDEAREIADLRADLRSQVWMTSLVAGLLGIGVAIGATRYAGRLESRIREQHAKDVEQRNELERLSARLMDAQEDERRRIARELHDEIGQALGAIKLELAVVEQRLERGTGRELADVRAMTDRALQSVRDLSRLVHPSMLDDLGLPDSAQSYLDYFSRRTGIDTSLDVANVDGRLSPAVEVCAYRVIQEAVTNVGRHAEASSCHVRLEREADTLKVTVQDDGRGFDPGLLNGADGLGLISLRERVTGLGGHLDIDSRTGRGTRVVAAIPLKVESHEHAAPSHR